ncbi:hypothetical protein PENCOP_c025G06904 [Penicillium coprophilum]|uniref:Carrier domain-containing protein n=1 Tax=Penicillium coprophilum TaxID=36646 RepID=A0A1V6U721_9EURO|nr:hypothetical protein PENCOP_c025G06904 [Penicillium coprophilum]
MSAKENFIANVKLTGFETVAQVDLEKIRAWNKMYPELIERCVHDIFEVKAHEQPNAFAICAWDGELLYGELDELATNLATRLTEMGVGPGLLVPLCFEKSMWTTVAMLGVLKAGGGFVMLDTSLPEHDLHYIIQQLKADLILSSVSNEALSSRLARNVVSVDRRLFTNSEFEPNTRLAPSDPFSVMCLNFTSGTTGTPKGVLLTHRNYTSALYHQAPHLGLTKESRVYDFLPYSVDLSIGQIFISLAVGACLCVPMEQDRTNKLAQSMTSLRENVAFLTPSVAQSLDPDDTPTLKSIVFTGERLRLTDVNRWWGKVRVRNVYGLCECTLYSVINDHASCPEEATRIGFGAGQVTWVVNPDNHDHLVPLGSIGELLLEGPLVSEGYLNHPEKTAISFIDNPVWRQGLSDNSRRHGRRLYKTGDLVRYNEDGSLTFVGRKDTQIKVRGQRVELDEIEYCLQKHLTQAKQVVVDVIIPKRENSSPVLAAFIHTYPVSGNSKQSEPSHIGEKLQTSTDVEDVLSRRLPEYMVPTMFFCMQELPMTVRGRLDRKRLSEIGTSGFDQFMDLQKQVTKSKPTSRIGLDLQRMVGRVLALDSAQVGLAESFLALGEDSIAAMQAVSDAQNTGVELKVLDAFRYPTLDSPDSRCHHVVEKASEKIPPFSLLRHSFNRNLLLQEIESQYRLNPATVEDAYSCTPLQEDLLSLSLKHPDESMIQRTMKLTQTIQTKNFCRAWDEMAQNTGLLRTRIFQCSNGAPVQLILSEKIQWTHTIGLNDYLEKDKKRPMELGGPLARYAIVTDSTGLNRWFVLTLHHVLYDSWSLSRMMDMVNEEYGGISTKAKHEFKRFIKYIEEQDSDKTGEYWRHYLVDCDCTPFPALPLSVQRPVADSDITHQIPWLNTKPRDISTTTLFRAAWALLANCMTNSNSVVFGTTTSGRRTPVSGINEVLGPTTAIVPFHVKLSGCLKVLDYLATVQQQAADMIPFEQFGLQRIAQTCPEAQQACQFQTLLTVQSQEITRSDTALGLWDESYKPEWVNTFALSFELQIGLKRINARFDSNVIEPWIVQSLLEGLEYVMKQLDTAGSQQSIAEVELVTPRSLGRIWDWNRTVPVPVSETITSMIREQIQKQPMATAIYAWDAEFTYGELDRLSAVVADQLFQFGVNPQLLGPEILVPLCFEKSAWTIVSILGVLKSGAGFVLLDPSLPEPRLKSILEQVGSKLMLSSQANMELSCRLSKMVVQIGPDLSQLWNTVSNFDSSHAMSPSLLQQPSRVMYAVFTSGSTGAPKGVLVSHESFCSAVHYQLELLSFTRESRVFDFASYAFDTAVHNALATLVAGGCLCIPSEKDRKDNLGNIMSKMRPTVVNLTPTVARLLDPGTVQDLKTLILLGEAVTTRDVEQWHSPRLQLINAYGPAECTPISTINASASNRKEAIQIGKGVGLVTWIVDPEDHNRLLPLGCTGELLLEGPLVGNGYMGEPEKTAEAFIKDPKWLLKGSHTQPGRHGRLYRTGDLAQYNEDGSLTFLRRKDSQVKIRGQRFELGEVEHHIHNCLPKASQVVTEVVVPEGEINPRPVLVAFIQANENDMETEEKPTYMAKEYPMAADIQKKLAHYLPSYMVPTLFFSLRDLPLTASGKTNRRRLHEIGRELLLSKGKQPFDTQETTLENGFSQKRPILETEQPAYTLAQKLHSIYPSWTQDNMLLREVGPQHPNLEFNDILLHSSGLDSANMMEFMIFISQNFHIQVGMHFLMDRKTTIRSLAQYLADSEAGPASTHPLRNSPALISTNLIAEINRHDARVLTAQRGFASGNKGTSNDLSRDENIKSFTVLLTGANGFVGTQILRRLLENRLVSRVVGLVRGETDKVARQRTIDGAMKALWWTNHHAEKLEVWRGDLSLPHLGLDPTRWDSLATGKVVNTIIHCGATVHWTRSYNVLEAANVSSTIELLLLSVRVQGMRFLYITGGRPWDSHEELDVAKELSVADTMHYSQTKFVSEAVVKRAARRNLSDTNRLAIFNPRWVIGTPTEGYSNPDDYIWRLVATCIKIGVYNGDDEDGWLAIFDVTTTATAIIDLALGENMERMPEKQPQDGMFWREFWAIIGGLGYGLKAKGAAEWLALVRADIEATRERHPMWPLAHIFGSLQNDERLVGSSREKRGSTPLRLKIAVARSAQFLVEVGFLPKPLDGM